MRCGPLSTTLGKGVFHDHVRWDHVCAEAAVAQRRGLPRPRSAVLERQSGACAVEDGTQRSGIGSLGRPNRPTDRGFQSDSETESRAALSRVPSAPLVVSICIIIDFDRAPTTRHLDGTLTFDVHCHWNSTGKFPGQNILAKHVIWGSKMANNVVSPTMSVSHTVFFALENRWCVASARC